VNKRIVAVVVTYNRLPALRRTLSHLLTQPLHAIVVVDNASTDGTQPFLAEQVDERVHVLTLPENLGGAGGFHAGVDYAHTHLDYDYLLLQDDDAWPEGAEWSQFIHSDWFPDAVATAVYYPSGTICPMNRPGWHPFKNWRQTWRTLLHGAQGFHVSPSHFQAAEATEVDFSSFVGLLVHRKVVDAVGTPDPDWFIYGDDVDYTLRMRKAGFSLLFVPWLRYIHDCETLVEGRKVYNPVWKAYYTYRNNLILARRVAGFWYPLVVLYRLISWWVATYRYPKDKRHLYLCLMKRAVLDGLRQKRPRLLATDVNELCQTP